MITPPAEAELNTDSDFCCGHSPLKRQNVALVNGPRARPWPVSTRCGTTRHAVGPRWGRVVSLPPDTCTCTCTCLKEQSPPSACVSSCHAHDSILVQPPLTPQGLLASRSRRTLPRCRTCSTRRRTAATTCPRRRCVAPAPPRCHVCARERGSRQRAPQQREGAASVCIRELPSMSFVEYNGSRLMPRVCVLRSVSHARAA